jgi:hypothetical protein
VVVPAVQAALATVLTVADMVHLEMQLMMVQAPKLKRWTKP